MKNNNTAVKNSIIFAGFFCCWSLNCGINTEVPVYPYFLTAPTSPAVGAPTIISLTTFESNTYSTGDLNYVPTPSGAPVELQFEITYYVTNTEDDFLGYNLYIRKTNIATNTSPAEAGSVPYRPRGADPSFVHVNDPPSTESVRLFTRRITHHVAPPGPKNFQLCEYYYFWMTASTRSGLTSPAGITKSACAAMDVSICPSGTPCNP